MGTSFEPLLAGTIKDLLQGRSCTGEAALDGA
jgi:hypothetical protein